MKPNLQYRKINRKQTHSTIKEREKKSISPRFFVQKTKKDLV